MHYFRLSSPAVIGEFNTIRDGKLIMLDHTLCLRNAIEGVSVEQLAAVAPLGYLAEDFQTRYFDYSGDKPLWILSNWADLARQAYRHNRTGITIPYHAPRTEAERVVHERMKGHLESEFTPVWYDESEVKKTLAMVFTRIPGHGLMFFLQINESDRGADGALVINPRRQALNRWCADVAADYGNVRLIRVVDFVEDDAEILNEKITHFDRKVYHRLYLHMIAEAQADLARTSPPTLSPP